MPVIVPNGFAQATFTHATVSPLGSKPVYTFGLGRAPSQALAEGLLLWWEQAIKPFLSRGVLLETIKLRSITGEYDLPVNQLGAVSGNFEQPQTAVLVQKRTGLAGRANRGRMYLPGMLLVANCDNGGNIEPGHLADLQLAADDLLDRAATDWGNLQLFHSGSSDPTTITSLPVLPHLSP